MAFGFIDEEDSVIYVCADCGHEKEEQILMGTLVCPACNGVMLPT
jgi:DNA-directed RNA polymerase subunit RPC12/RpoP